MIGNKEREGEREAVVKQGKERSRKGRKKVEVKIAK